MINFTGRLIIDNTFNTKSIISYGLIVYALDSEKILIIQRKHSVEFVLLMTGNYRPTYLPFLISMLTALERDHLYYSLQDESYFKNLYIKEFYSKRLNIKYVYTRLMDAKEEIINLLFFFRHKINYLTWHWPKGRPNNSKEDGFACAKREFIEEVEVFLPKPLVIDNQIYLSTAKALGGRNIKNKYFFCVIEKEFSLPETCINDEVSNRKWVKVKSLKKYMNVNIDGIIIDQL